VGDPRHGGPGVPQRRSCLRKQKRKEKKGWGVGKNIYVGDMEAGDKKRKLCTLMKLKKKKTPDSSKKDDWQKGYRLAIGRRKVYRPTRGVVMKLKKKEDEGAKRRTTSEKEFVWAATRMTPGLGRGSKDGLPAKKKQIKRTGKKSAGRRRRDWGAEADREEG